MASVTRRAVSGGSVDSAGSVAGGGSSVEFQSVQGVCGLEAATVESETGSTVLASMVPPAAV
ncbi:hypothetical protein GXW82_23845 [Streptacidiphilus sp. 4-A2]|nr:hypothetical protein [Streptacidiphilus sp. 4-A2]